MTGAKVHHLKAEPGRFDYTPYHMARLAYDIFQSAKSFDSGKERKLYRYFLYSVAIELVLKALLLNNNNTQARKDENQRIRHDLSKLSRSAQPQLPDGFLTADDIRAIDDVSPFFSGKALEYPSGEMIKELLTGARNLPSIQSLEAVAEKLVDHASHDNFFSGSDTTDAK
ncbi:hypothetical protein GQ651_09295 [Alphaproteobacteria bacterium GH1-50]|uniref:HEPN domain-containing protein n=1 Tax=Kangsaoukella pontilimi TaxID=2691042 RepID=A0A7C9MR63_9RHOB|nr:hypothetical protein [Kangsaoukella pontilimi]MXQ08037.1 hypothetical protein [Kangsaoukella pontilimi]